LKIDHSLESRASRIFSNMHEFATWLGRAPALLLHEGPIADATGRGTILFYHGLGAAKEANLLELRSLASRGYLVAGIDVVGHGERRFPDFDRRFGADDPRPAVIETVVATAEEVPAVVTTLCRDFGASEDGIGICGISLGGFVTYGALLADERISVATPILGSPRWWPDEATSPHRRLDGYFPRAILSQNAGRDENVRPHEAREFHAALAPHYAHAPDRQRYLEYPYSGHFMTERDWAALWDNVLAWFDRYLAARA
jgi:pimeloyl-ACP methyl ester carboxylesterase